MPVILEGAGWLKKVRNAWSQGPSLLAVHPTRCHTALDSPVNEVANHERSDLVACSPTWVEGMFV